MTLNEWPQWLVAFILVLPVFTWWVKPVFGLVKNWIEWWGGYLGRITFNAITAYVLYCGGFWS